MPHMFPFPSYPFVSYDFIPFRLYIHKYQPDVLLICVLNFMFLLQYYEFSSEGT